MFKLVQMASRGLDEVLYESYLFLVVLLESNLLILEMNYVALK